MQVTSLRGGRQTGRFRQKKTRPPAEYNACAALPCPDIEIGLRHPVPASLPDPAWSNVIYFTFGAKSLRRVSWGRAPCLDPGRSSVTPPRASCDRGDNRNNWL